MPVQTLTLEYPFGAPPPNIHCPVCGVAVSKMNEEIQQPACPHVEYIYLSDICQFDFIRPELEAEVENATVDENGEEPDAISVLCQRESKTKVAISLLTGGMACGPVWNQVWFGFDLGPQPSLPVE